MPDSSSARIAPPVPGIGRSSRQGLALALILAALCLSSLPCITGRPVIKDAAESLQIALNLQHHGAYSEDHGPPYTPTMIREPVPILTTAASVWAVDALMGRAAADTYFSGERARYLKLQNLLWLALLMAAAACSMRFFGYSLGWQAVASVSVALPFTLLVPPPDRYAIGVDSLCTELPGAALLCAGSLALAIALARNSNRLLWLASLLFGLLALTKAAFFYVYPLVLVATVALQGAAPGRAWLGRPTLLRFLALVVPFTLLTGLWLARNYTQTGFAMLAERGGPIVLYRGLLDGMSGEEYAGSFYAWAPNGTAQAILHRLTGFGPADLEAGGRLQHLAMGLAGAAGERDRQSEDRGEPASTLTWYRGSRAAYEAYLRDATAAGMRYPPGSADELTRQAGFKLIERRPLMHMALFLPLLWRGATLTFPLLVLTLAYCWWARRADLALLALPALGIVLFYAMITHFVQRYGWLPRPASTIALVVIVAELRRHGWPRRRAPEPARDLAATAEDLTRA